MAQGHTESEAFAICNAQLYGSSQKQRAGFDGQMAQEMMQEEEQQTTEGVTLSAEQTQALVDAAFVAQDIAAVQTILSDIVNIEDVEQPAPAE